MTNTTNYGLRKPDTSDFYDVQDFNYNADVLDEKLYETARSIPAGLHSGIESISWVTGEVVFKLLDDDGEVLQDDDGTDLLVSQFIQFK